MFLSDETVVYYLAGTILLTFPWLGVAWGTWGFIWEVLMLLAVFLVGRRKGWLITTGFLLIGYVAPLLVLGETAINQMSLVPLAGLLGILGWHKHWPVRRTFFWSAMLAAVLGALPTLSFVTQGFDAKTVNDMINMIVQQYQASGLLAVIQQQGITEMQVRDFLQQGIHFYALIIPSFAAISAFIEFGLVFYLVRRWFKEDEGRIPFTRWSLPWYAVWGAVLGIAFYLLGDQFSWTVLRGLGINLMVVYGALTLVLGTSVFLYLLQSPKIPRFIKLALIIASFFYFFFSVISLIMFGLFDLVFNFRRLPEES
ncbi:putative membrane protein [Candidatus Desulfosporosinus infrequens]|uniref:Putative membrane protein n=1 Tax=Candidatus Desulfosporosinus infrequens TaxID=2043169 RepID=A0A2U3JYL8_9FIRM|nr:putative membrane protein [Candidatus Desulfosporosinus infrequens]